MPNPDTNRVFTWLAEHTAPLGEMCANFKPMMRDLELDRAAVRRACRLLKRQGLVEFHVGLSDEDGNLRGSGYCISSSGLAKAEHQS
jgi:hypothetical protein